MTKNAIIPIDSGAPRRVVMVIYPEETWYTFIDEQDVDEIIQEHLVEGRVVERLKL